MDSRVQFIVEALSKSCNGTHNLDDLATALRISVSRLRHLMKTEFGMPPGKYSRLVRMQRACDLIENTFLSVKEVANQAGFNDVSHFVRDFKKIFGLSPRMFRRAKTSPKSTLPITPATKANS